MLGSCRDLLAASTISSPRLHNTSPVLPILIQRMCQDHIEQQNKNQQYLIFQPFSISVNYVRYFQLGGYTNVLPILIQNNNITQIGRKILSLPKLFNFIETSYCWYIVCFFTMFSKLILHVLSYNWQFNRFNHIFR